MEFRTQIRPTQQPVQIHLGDRFVSLGSCFANSIDQKLKENKFRSLNNPLGILFDPYSIARSLTYAIEGTRPEDNSYYTINDFVVNLETHSDMRGISTDEVVQSIDARLNLLSHSLKEANWLILTFGTSWVYKHIERNLQVANCHKIPQKEFEKSLLTIDHTKQVYDELLDRLRSFNPDLHIIVTVSPVRHLKDTLPLNNLSKSHLLLLSHYLSSTHKQVYYYPSYELIVDDLRDYRFYNSDMLHPNDQAIHYVWEHFTQSYFDNRATQFLKEWDSIRKALDHKPFNPSSPTHQRFVKSTLEQLNKFAEIINIEEEKHSLLQQLLNA